jgi:ADP-ribose pyrophosphatase YjhB (NUDIX family)
MIPNRHIKCPECDTNVDIYKNPIPTVDIIIECKSKTMGEGIVLILRKNEPKNWAIPGGFLDYGEKAEDCAVREAKEETSLDVTLKRQFHTYSDPTRDPRKHTITVVFIAKAEGEPFADDDAQEIGIFNKDNIPADLAFDHNKILDDYFSVRY